MKIGFIGAGKVGFTLGKYMAERNVYVSGYYSKNTQSAKEASEFTRSRYYKDLAHIVNDSDVLFLTVPDGQILPVWEQLRECKLKGKIICHCSGAMSSAVFSEIDQMQAFGYSIHPLFAVSSKLTSYRDISKAYFTIEGHEEKLSIMKAMIEAMGNPVAVIDADKKSVYHAAAALISNHVTALVSVAQGLLTACGFEETFSDQALMPLFVAQSENIEKSGVKAALTGPVERNDVQTVEKHLDVLHGDCREVYRLLSKELVNISREKHPERDYTPLESLLMPKKGE